MQPTLPYPSQCIGLERKPVRVGEIGGGLNHDGRASRPVDVETEPIGLKIRSTVARRGQPGLPRPGGEAANRVAPISGAGKIIESRTVIAREYGRAKQPDATSRAIDSYQISTEEECMITNRTVAGDDNVGQRRAVRKGTIPKDFEI